MTPNPDAPRGRSRSRRALDDRQAFPEGSVTGLRALDAGGARFLLTIGDVDACVSAELIAEFKLAPGRVVSAADADALTMATHRLLVFDRAVSLLSFKPRSGRELAMALRRRGAAKVDCEAAIARLEELGLVDDAGYARQMARGKLAGGRTSKRRVQQELARRGIAPALAREALGEAIEDVGLDEFDAALGVARKRMRSLRGEEAPTVRRRLYAFLARRGYAAAVASRVTAQVMSEGDDPQDAGADAE